jgi:asparagine synthase (glutamine-hydrolysing)
MCGFLGLYSPRPLYPERLPSLQQSAAHLLHRGNTSSGEHFSQHIAFFHYRLAFRDLQSGGQPLYGPEQKSLIIYNGELYDFQKLRSSLSYPFQTRSDTEVILAAYHTYGEKLLTHLDGEYAFAIYDDVDKSVLLGRDPFGVKPLYFTNASLEKLGKSFFREYRPRYEFELDGEVSFASEIKALPTQLHWDQEGLQRQICGLYEEMHTAFANVIALAPGSTLRIRQRGGKLHCVLERRVEKKRKPVRGDFSFSESAHTLRSLIGDNVRQKLDSEVPLGVYLSGGVDSRIVAHEMGKLDGKIDSFTVGFEGEDFDERGEVQNFLNKYPNIHSHTLGTTDSALAYSYEHAIYASEMVQPYTNGCAKWWLSRFARRTVRGVLTGDGADELFCGYPSYKYLAWWSFLQRDPKSKSRQALYSARMGGGEKIWEKGLSSREDGQDLRESREVLGWYHPLYAQLKAMSSLWSPSDNAALQWLKSTRMSLMTYVDMNEKGASPLTVWQNYFLHTHFPSHVLNWVGDRMEMANTLEGRPIYLSNSTRNFVQSLPDHALVRGMTDKAILRAAYREELKDFSATPKKQFNAPFLQTPAFQQRYFSSEALKRSNIIPPGSVERGMKMLQSPDLSPLLRSYTQMFLQNLLVVQMLDEFLVKKRPPVRDIAFEEKFLDEHTRTMGNKQP